MNNKIDSKFIWIIDSIQGRVSIGTKTVVKRGAIVRGPCIIGENCLIESNVYIGPYTSIRNNSGQ